MVYYISKKLKNHGDGDVNYNLLIKDSYIKQ